MRGCLLYGGQTHDVSDSVPAEVQLCKRAQASQTRHYGDLVAGQIQDPQVGQVREILYLLHLRGRGGEPTNQSDDSRS